MDMKIASTIGFERRHNELLRVEDEESFVERAIASLGAAAAELRGDRGDEPRPSRHHRCRGAGR